MAKQLRILLDMDGVVADFVRGICDLWGFDNLYLKPEFEYKKDSYNDICSQDYHGIPPQKFWGAQGYEFWLNLHKTPEADEIVKAAVSAAGVDNVAFLTSPVRTLGCQDGKRAWARHHYPDIPVILSNRADHKEPPKWMLASDNSILVDDADKNVQLWTEYGGPAFLFPRPWNAAGTRGQDGVREWREYLDAYIGAMDSVSCSDGLRLWG